MVFVFLRSKRQKKIQPLFIIGSVYSKSASGADQTTQRNYPN